MNAVLAERIVNDPDRTADGAFVRNTGISVDEVLAALVEDPTAASVLLQYPSLEVQDIRAALAYARERIASAEATPKFGKIDDLGWTPEQAARVREQLKPFADDWDDPSMNVYDALPPAR
jgi:uncharacterized protein (DUF433 family)